MSKGTIMQTISVLAIMTIIAGISIMPKSIAQPTPSSNATMAKNDSVERAFAKAPPKVTAGAMQPDNYSAWLIICGRPPIENVETQCDPPTQLH